MKPIFLKQTRQPLPGKSPHGTSRAGGLMVVMAAAVLLLAAYPQALAQDSDDAFFIDADGRVGIGNRAPRATLDVRGTIRGIGIVPPGGIVMFSGDVGASFDTGGQGLKGTPYEGWQLCNGKNGAPDLSNRFVLAFGAEHGKNIGETGGLEKVTLEIKHLPSHDHGGSTGEAKTKFPTVVKGVVAKKAGLVIQTTPASGPNMTEPSHKHSIPAQGGKEAHENMPPYYVLAFIMKL